MTHIRLSVQGRGAPLESTKKMESLMDQQWLEQMFIYLRLGVFAFEDQKISIDKQAVVVRSAADAMQTRNGTAVAHFFIFILRKVKWRGGTELSGGYCRWVAGSRRRQDWKGRERRDPKVAWQRRRRRQADEAQETAHFSAPSLLAVIACVQRGDTQARLTSFVFYYLIAPSWLALRILLQGKMNVETSVAFPGNLKMRPMMGSYFLDPFTFSSNVLGKLIKILLNGNLYITLITLYILFYSCAVALIFSLYIFFLSFIFLYFLFRPLLLSLLPYPLRLFPSSSSYYDDNSWVPPEAPCKGSSAGERARHLISAKPGGKQI